MGNKQSTTDVDDSYNASYIFIGRILNFPKEFTPCFSRFLEGEVITGEDFSNVRNKYHIDENQLGRGTFGVVRKCVNRETRECYAIKSIRKNKGTTNMFLRREVTALKDLDHPNIIKLIEVVEDDHYVHFITELCTGGELYDRIKSQTPRQEICSEKESAELIRCVLDAVRYCHEKNIVHRDLKLENLLFKTTEKDSPIKIIDFGLAFILRQDKVMESFVGTPYYMAPEILSSTYTKSCDLWSVGVITYIILCGYPPFYGSTSDEIYNQAQEGRLVFHSPEWDNISSEAKDFVRSLVRLNPNDRLTAGEALEHEWIASNRDVKALRRVSAKSAEFQKDREERTRRKAEFPLSN
jgi:calcium-dependent protein kinase